MEEIIYYVRKKQEPLIAKVTEAALAGLKHQGVDFKIKFEDEYEPSKIAILFGFYKNVNRGGRKRKEIYDGQKESGNKIMVLERGFLRRDLYHSVGWDGINGRANFNNLNRPNDRFKKLNIELKPWKNTGDTILVCGQTPWDSNLQHINTGCSKKIEDVQGYLTWLGNITKSLVKRFKNRKEVVFRPHPLFGRQYYYESVIPKEVRWSKANFQNDLKDAWACCAFNSNSVVEAVIEGTHGFVFDQGSVAYNYVNNDIKKMKKPELFNREKMLSEIAYAQWNLEEIGCGLFWKALNEKR